MKYTYLEERIELLVLESVGEGVGEGLPRSIDGQTCVKVGQELHTLDCR